MGGKWAELLKEVAPQLKRVVLVFNPKTAPYSNSLLRSVQAAECSLELDVTTAPIHSDAELELVAGLAKDPGNGRSSSRIYLPLHGDFANSLQSGWATSGSLPPGDTGR